MGHGAMKLMACAAGFGLGWVLADHHCGMLLLMMVLWVLVAADASKTK